MVHCKQLGDVDHPSKLLLCVCYAEKSYDSYCNGFDYTNFYLSLDIKNCIIAGYFNSGKLIPIFFRKTASFTNYLHFTIK